MPTGRKQTQDPDVDQLARLMMAWTGMSMKIAKGNPSAKVLADTGMTLQQIVALHILMFVPSVSVSLLTEHLGLSTSATSHLVQRLVEQGVVDRVEDPADRRQKKLSLTAAGRKLIEKLMKARLNEFRQTVLPLSAALRADLKAVLERVVDELSWISAESCVDPRLAASKDARGAASKETKISEEP